MREVWRDVANGSGFAFYVEQRDVAFGRGIELEDLRDVETVLEGLPYLRRQTVAAGQMDAMAGVMPGGGRVQCAPGYAWPESGLT